MNDLLRRRFESCLRGQVFGVAHADSFPSGSEGRDLCTRLDGVITRIEAHATEHDTGTRAGMQVSVSKTVARDTLLAQLEAINRTSRSIAKQSPGLLDKFRMPAASPTQDLLKAARSFLANATPIKADFIRRGLPEDVLEKLATAISNLETAIDQGNRTKGAKVSARVAQDNDVGEGMSLMQELDVVVRNVFADDPAVLAEWTSASHVQRHTTGGKQPEPPPPPPPPKAPTSTPDPGSSDS